MPGGWRWSAGRRYSPNALIGLQKTANIPKFMASEKGSPMVESAGRIGGRADLPRSMGLPLATTVVIANVIGVGIFTTSGLLARGLPDARILLCVWTLGGVLALSGALCYAELGARFPSAGGEYAFLKEAYGPLPSFLSGWASLFAGFSAPIAAAAVGFTEYLSFYFPILRTQGGDVASRSPVLPGHLVAASVIILLSLLHYRRVQVGAPVHISLTSFKVGIILIFIVCGFLLGRGDLTRFAPALPLSSWPSLSPAIAAGLIFVMFSYSGWNAAAYIGGEIRDPHRNIPRALIVGTLVVILLYLSINALYLYAIPVSQMAKEIRIAEVASLNLFGLNIAPWLSLIFMGTILSSISAMVIAGPRIYYAMAQDGLFPEAIARIHPRFGTPANAIALQSVWAVALVFTGRFEQLLTFSGVVMIGFSALTVASLFLHRLKKGAAPSPYSAWGYPFTAIIFLAVSIWILALSFRDQPKESFAGLAVVGSGIPFFYFWNRRRRE